MCYSRTGRTEPPDGVRDTADHTAQPSWPQGCTFASDHTGGSSLLGPPLGNGQGALLPLLSLQVGTTNRGESSEQ